jgi:hypothetical protein
VTFVSLFARELGLHLIRCQSIYLMSGSIWGKGGHVPLPIFVKPPTPNIHLMLSIEKNKLLGGLNQPCSNLFVVSLVQSPHLSI